MIGVICIIVIFLGINIAIGKYQAYRFDVEQSRINHTTWAFFYALVCFQSFWLFHNLWLIAACVVMHLPVFNTALNYCRKPRRPLYYTHPEDPRGSWMDRLWAKSYPLVFWASLILLLILIYIACKKTLLPLPASI